MNKGLLSSPVCLSAFPCKLSVELAGIRFEMAAARTQTDFPCNCDRVANFYYNLLKLDTHSHPAISPEE